MMNLPKRLTYMEQMAQRKKNIMAYIAITTGEYDKRELKKLYKQNPEYRDYTERINNLNDWGFMDMCRWNLGDTKTNEFE